MYQKICTSIILALAVSLAGSLWAAQTTFVTHDTEAAFAPGKAEGVVIGSEGTLRLGRPVEPLLADSNDVWVVNDLAQLPNGRVVAATSGKGRIYVFDHDSAEVIYEGAGTGINHVFSIAVDSTGRILAGTGGRHGRLLRGTANGAFETLFEADEVSYIWAIVPLDAGAAYIATGPEGLIYRIAADGAAEVIYDAEESNILCLALDEAGRLYAGGDEYGMIYRIDPTSGAVRVVYDSDHSEISSLVFDAQGNLYAATADAGLARPAYQLTLSEGAQGYPEEALPPVDNGGGNLDATDPTAESPADDKAENSDDDPAGPTADEADDESPAEIVPTEETADTSSAPTAAPLNEGPATTAARSTTPGAPSGRGSAAAAPANAGNQVFQISPAGFVRSVFRRPVVMLALAVDKTGAVLVGTGNEGKLLRLDVAAEKAAVLYDAEDSLQISAALVAENGTVYAGGANPGSVAAIATGYVAEGVFTSDVIDAGQVSRWGQMQIDAAMPPGAQVTVAARTGNTSDPDLHAWSDWSAPASASEAVAVDAEPGRFLQYRLTLTGTRAATPTVRRVRVPHLTPNLPPRITTLDTQRGAGDSQVVSPPRAGLLIRWQATDANQDQLTYEVAVRPEGAARWIVVAEDITESQYVWDTLTAADGRYEIRVKADDSASNPPGAALTASRISDPVIVDNTPPQRLSIDLQVSGRRVYVQTTARDALTVLAGVRYTVNSSRDWRTTLPNDGIFDSREETVAFDFEVDEPGPHVLTIRYEDAAGNVRYENVNFEIEP